jgi:hypothetical protein
MARFRRRHPFSPHICYLRPIFDPINQLLPKKVEKKLLMGQTTVKPTFGPVFVHVVVSSLGVKHERTEPSADRDGVTCHHGRCRKIRA